MDMEIMAALLMCILSFFVLYLLMRVFKRTFNFEFSAFMGVITFIAILVILYIKRDLFFGTSIFSGMTSGVLLFILWRAGKKGHLSEILKAIFSARFISVAVSIGLGIYFKGFTASLWSKFFINRLPKAKPYLIYIILAAFIIGIASILFSQNHGNGRDRRYSFRIYRRTSPVKRIIKYVTGIILLLISSGALLDALRGIF